MMCTVPLEPNSIETLVIVSLSGASTMFTKSYLPIVAYCSMTLAPSFSISLLTSLTRSGRSLIVFLPSEVRVVNMMYIAIKTTQIKEN